MSNTESPPLAVAAAINSTYAYTTSKLIYPILIHSNVATLILNLVSIL